MSQCPNTEYCRFFALDTQPAEEKTEALRGRYCTGNYVACARYAVGKAKGRANVPRDLYPHQHAEARRLLASGPE